MGLSSKSLIDDLVADEMDVVAPDGWLHRNPRSPEPLALDVGDDLVDLRHVGGIRAIKDAAKGPTDGQRPRSLEGLDDALLYDRLDRHCSEQESNDITRVGDAGPYNRPQIVT